MNNRTLAKPKYKNSATFSPEFRKKLSSQSFMSQSVSEARDVSNPEFGHNFGDVQVENPSFKQSCPLALPGPSHCPFGGTCHTCPPRVQAKLKIGQPGDKYEQEADRVAEQVMRMSEPQVQRKACSSCNENDEEELVQAKPVAGRITPLVQRQVEEEEDEEEILQTKEVSGQTPENTKDIKQDINNLRCRGKSLPKSTRSFFEKRFGHDFSQVRVHIGARATQLTRDVNARAFTVGRDVVFGAGQYEPETNIGQRLLAHELAHTIQQSDQHINCDTGTSNNYDGIHIQRKEKSPTPGKNRCGGWTCASKTDCLKTDSKKTPSKTASKSWAITVMLDLDVESARDISSGADVGHSFVKFDESNGDGYTYGYYHDKTASPNFIRSTVPGCAAHPDTTHRKCVDMEVHLDLKKQEYNNALHEAQNWCITRPNYDLYNKNCTTFVAKVAKAAGKILPTYRSKAGYGRLAGMADNPYALFESYVSPSEKKTWQEIVSGKFEGHFDSNGRRTKFDGFEISVDEFFSLAAKYTYTHSSGRIVEGTVKGRMILRVDGAKKSIKSFIEFEWNEPGGASGRGVWVVSKTGNLRGTWGRKMSANGGGRWELKQKP